MTKRFPKCRHRMTEDNTYHDPNKGDRCRVCIRAYQRAYMRDVYRPRKKRERRR